MIGLTRKLEELGLIKHLRVKRDAYGDVLVRVRYIATKYSTTQMLLKIRAVPGVRYVGIISDKEMLVLEIVFLPEYRQGEFDF